MNGIRTFLCVLALAGGPWPARAQDVALDCAGPIADCLISEAEALAGTVARASQMDEIHFSVAVALGDMGRVDAALDTAGRIDDPRTLAEALGQIAGTAARAGAFDRAREIALSIIDGRVKSPQIAALETLAVELGAAGKIDEAFETVVAIDNPFRRSEAQARIALSVARSGDIPGGIRAATRIATNYWFTVDQAGLKIASGLVSRSGEFDHFWFYEALAAIARLQAETGDVLGGLQTARSIPEVTGRSRATAGIARVQAESGDIEGALATARGIEAAYGDLEAMVAVARAMAAAGHFDGALDLANEVARAYGDASALAAVAIEQAGRGAAGTALLTAVGIDNLDSRTQALSGVSAALAKDGQLEEALKLLPLIPEAGDQATLVRELAVLLATADAPERALDLAERFAAPRDRGEVTVAIALAQARAGDAPGAIATALLLEDEMLRAIALAGIAPFAR